MGAVESQPVMTLLLGDYHLDGTVDAVDYVIWRFTLGDTLTAGSGADGSGNGVVDQADYQVWQSNFGRTLPVGEVGAMDEAILRFSSNHNWFDESRSDGRVNTPLERVVTAKSRHFDLLLILDAGHSSPLSTAARDAAISDGNDVLMDWNIT
jgi:hypothetical protein